MLGLRAGFYNFRCKKALSAKLKHAQEHDSKRARPTERGKTSCRGTEEQKTEKSEGDREES